MNSLLIKNGRIIDPLQGTDTIGDLLIENSQIAALGQVPTSAELTIDAAGLIVAPGLIDLHTHLRQPGCELAETILSGSRAAVCGGFTAVAAMPNTTPCIDTPRMVRFVLEKARRALCRVHVVAAITTARQGRQLADLSALARVGASAFSNDGDWLPTAELMRQALDQAARLNLPIIQHCQDPRLGSSSDSETSALSRDISLLSGSSCRYHVAHVSTAAALELIRRAKSQGLAVSAEATPHHLCLTDELSRGLDPVYKVRPPLRSPADVAAVKSALAKGTIDCLACDHAPHTAADKARDFADAPAGMIGLETALGVYITELIETGLLTWPQLIRKLTVNPAAVLGLDVPRIDIGSTADITLIDPTRRWLVQPQRFRSLSRNCPFAERTLTGKAVATIVAGRIRYLDSLDVTGNPPDGIICN